MAINNRKIILIGGTAYSGSTMLDMILGNDPKGFSTGEYRGYFFPWRLHHLQPHFNSKEAAEFWGKVKKNKLVNIYRTIFSELPHLDFIVDSSKNPFWLKKMERIAFSHGYQVKHVLLWKTPEEFAYSMYKRKKINYWRKSWKSYYKLYLSLFDDYIPVNYSMLVKNEGYLKKICEALEIPYFETKREFWNKDHYTMAGNRSAKIHLYKKDSDLFKESSGTLIDDHIDNKPSLDNKYRKIYYEIDNEFLKNYATSIEEEIQSDQAIKKILQILENSTTSEAENNPLFNGICYNSLQIAFRKIKNDANYLFARIKVWYLINISKVEGSKPIDH